MSEPLYTTLCLGVTPSYGCGNDGVDSPNSSIFINVTQEALDSRFFPTRTPYRTGWVAVAQEFHSSYAVILQLVRMLTRKGVLTGRESYDVFNKAMPKRIGQGKGGAFITLCLGATLRRGCINDKDYEIFVNVTQTELDNDFYPHRTPDRTGWVVVHPEAYMPYAILLWLIQLLVKKGILTGDDPYHIFQQADSVRVHQSNRGQFMTLCLRLLSEQRCDNDSFDEEPSDIIIGVSQAELDQIFDPYLIPNRTGWAVIQPEAYTPYTILQQLVRILNQKGYLLDDEPYDVFNKSVPVSVRSWL